LASYNTEFALIRDEMRQGFAKVDQRFAKVDQEFASVRGEMQQGFAKVDQEFASVRGDIHLLRWMVGANFPLTLAVFVKLFVH
jgi:hypothetical protein